MATIEDLRRIAEIEFNDLVIDTCLIGYKLRILLRDGSYIDVHLSQKLPDKFGFHWECIAEPGTLYRYDNFPDSNWKHLKTYPYHFHDGSQDRVVPSPFPLGIHAGFRAFLEFIRNKI